MFCKHIVGDVKSNGTKILNREYRRRAGIPFPKRMNLPKARYETGNVGNHSIDANAFIAETALLLNVMIQCPAQILPVQIVYRFIFQYPLFFRDIVVTNFACVFEYAGKDSAMERNVSLGTKKRGSMLSLFSYKQVSLAL